MCADRLVHQNVRLASVYVGRTKLLVSLQETCRRRAWQHEVIRGHAQAFLEQVCQENLRCNQVVTKLGICLAGPAFGFTVPRPFCVFVEQVDQPVCRSLLEGSERVQHAVPVFSGSPSKKRRGHVGDRAAAFMSLDRKDHLSGLKEHACHASKFQMLTCHDRLVVERNDTGAVSSADWKAMRSCSFVMAKPQGILTPFGMHCSVYPLRL